MRDLRELLRQPFSRRTAWDLGESEWAALLAEKRRRGELLYDLTSANPTVCEFLYDPALLQPLLNAQGKLYDPEPRGLLEARDAVRSYYYEHHQRLNSGQQLSLSLHQIFLTTSTSEAYSFLFRLLCDPGDEVLIAQPSYPLFDFLADLDDIRLVSYPLFYDFGWHLDLQSLRSRITARTRAIIIVHPNNPTGHYTDPQTRAALERLCAEEGIALIVDEVFLDYSFADAQSSFSVGEHSALTFVMSGLSKVAGLPQMKLSWICAFGPDLLLTPALSRLELIADTFLSLSSPMQHALPVWLNNRHAVQQQITARIRENLAYLDQALTHFPKVDRLIVEGGWYVILRIPALASGEEASLQLLLRANCVVHPGVFFGLPPAGWLVISLLPPPAAFAEGVQAMLKHSGQRESD